MINSFGETSVSPQPATASFPSSTFEFSNPVENVSDVQHDAFAYINKDEAEVS